MNIILIGLRGSGKTSLGKSLSKSLGINFIDTDKLIEGKTGEKIVRIVKEHGWSYFRQIENKVIHKLEKTENSIISTGGGAVLDSKNRKILKGLGRIIYLECDSDTSTQRILGHKNRPHLTKAKNIQHEMEILYKERHALYLKLCDQKINTAQKNIKELECEILQYIEPFIYSANFLVIGSGISGLNFALNAAKKGKVILITKKKLIDSNTNFAQGGIAAVLDQADNFQKHIRDTLEAGAFHNNRRAVEFMVKKAPQAIKKLLYLGVKFEQEKDHKFKLTQEGGHRERRIAFVGDYTGKAIEKTLVEKIKENPNIKIFEDTFATDLIINKNNCLGIGIIKKSKQQLILADYTILATGGVGQIYKHTTNPKIATGDGLAMGIRAGLKTQDLEFIQFHPTALARKLNPKFLISETVRGEGGILLNNKGEKFMAHKHPLKDLAPRSIVAREIYKELQKGAVYIDIRHKSKTYLQKRFPQIYQKLLNFAIGMEKDLIPIVPAAHYICGGLATNLQGKTKINRLLAFGEVTCTGVHGANRLASNSLLEALVFSDQIIHQIRKKNQKKFLKINKKNIIESNKRNNETANKIKKDIQGIMWRYCGIYRNPSEIYKYAIPEIQKLIKKIDQIEIKGVNQEIIEAKNMAIISFEIAKSAAKRHKTLGCHFTQ